jgi:hypothetical protein
MSLFLNDAKLPAAMPGVFVYGAATYGMAELQKDGDWVIVDEVPLFDAHDEFDETKLNIIAANSNNRVKDTGDAVPLVIGHRKEGQPEEQQPPVVGFASNFRVKPWGKLKPRPTIYARLRFFKDKWEYAKQFPRRSIELWKDSMTIDPIALLGATPGARDLGLLFSKEGAEIYRYELKKENDAAKYDEDSTMEEQAIVDKLWSMFENSSWAQWCKAKMEQEAKDAESDEEPVSLAKDEKEEEPEKNDGGGSGGGTNLDKEEESEEEKKAEYERKTLRHQVEMFSRENQVIKTQLETLQQQLARTDREKDLTQLQAEGYDLDVNEELDHLQHMGPDQYSKALTLIRKHYQRAPVGVPYIRPANPEPKEFTKEDMKTAMEMTASGKMTYEQAVKEIKKNKA